MSNTTTRRNGDCGGDDARVVCDLVRHQHAATLVRQPSIGGGLIMHSTHDRNKNRLIRNDPVWLKTLLISLSLAFLGLFLILPLVVVFYEAFRSGMQMYLRSFNDTAAWQRLN